MSGLCNALAVLEATSTPWVLRYTYRSQADRRVTRCRAACAHACLLIPPSLSQIPFPCPGAKKIEENSIQLVLLKEGRTPTKVEFVFELLSAVVRPDGEIANTTMPSIPIVSTVCRKNSVDEVGDLLVAFVQVRSNTGM